jgi:hypothetical protein
MGHAEYSVEMGLQLPGRDVQRKFLSTEALILNGLLVQEVPLTYQ